MKLRPYQEKVISDAISGFKETNRQLIVLPTGSGKTVVFSHIVQKLNRKTLIVAHTKELIEQSERTLKTIVKNVPYKVMSIQKASVHLSRGKLKNQGYEFLIIDECHRSGALSYQNLIERLSQEGNLKILGTTATPFRSDGQRMKDIFGEPICSFTMIDMIKEGFLCDYEGYRVRTDCSLKGISTQKGDFISARLAPIINVKNRNELIVNEWKKIASECKTLCFTANIAHAEDLAKSFRDKGITCEAVHGELSKTRRQSILKDFKEGIITVITNCQILTEGFDEPSITCLLMARPTTSKVLYIQMIGRGSRTFPGKSLCKVIEFTDNEYDVCSIEDIFEANAKKYKIRHGERLSDYGIRVEKELLNETDHTVIEKMDVFIPKNIYEKPASVWQRQYLSEKQVVFSEPLTEFVANQLIIGISN
jgi:ATP-dependent helicase IRC3